MIDKIFEKRKEQIELILNLPRAELVKLLQECPHEALNSFVAGQEEAEIQNEDEELNNREEELKKVREKLGRHGNYEHFQNKTKKEGKLK